MSVKEQAGWKPDIRDEGGGWFSVQSESAPGCRYLVDTNVGACNCSDFHFQNRRQCKHIEAVRIFIADTSQQASMTGDQREFLNKMAVAVVRMVALGAKAKGIGCLTLASDLETIARLLACAIDLQRRALSPDTQVRTDALAESELPFRVV
jgi:hypothetical protein